MKTILILIIASTLAACQQKTATIPLIVPPYAIDDTDDS